MTVNKTRRSKDVVIIDSEDQKERTNGFRHIIQLLLSAADEDDGETSPCKLRGERNTINPAIIAHYGVHS